MLSHLLTPGERFALVLAAVILSAVGWGALAWYIVGAWQAFCAYGGILGGSVAWLCLRALGDFSADDLQRRRLDMVQNARWLERKARAEAQEAGVNVMPQVWHAEVTTGSTTMIGRIPERWVDYIRKKYAEYNGRNPSHKTYPALPDEVWTELRRLGLIADKGAGKHAGVEWTEVGREWLASPTAGKHTK